jgi:hypothetical protein
MQSERSPAGKDRARPKPRTAKRRSDAQRLARLAGVFDRLAGPHQGRLLLRRLLQTREPLAPILKDIAKTPEFAILYKEARTLDIMSSGSREADPAYVGLEEYDPGLPFAEQFERYFRPLLHRRAEGFATIFEIVMARHERPLIVETGCLRVPGNWEGDGQSTFMFDALARDRRSAVISIDVTPESIDSARRACSSTTQLILNDSVAALHALSRVTREPVALLYLDSFDLDPAAPMPSAIHHLKELAAARPLIGPGTVICVDDYAVAGEIGGKGLLVDELFRQFNLRVLYSGYQKIWLFE